MPSLLSQLKTHSIVVADTGDLEAIRRFAPHDATTNPSLILSAVRSGQPAALLDELVQRARAFQDGLEAAVEDVCDRLCVAMGSQILQQVPGKVSTEIDPRLSFNAQASIDKARRLVELYERAGMDCERILIKLAATWEGIRAAQVLEREGIQCNLTLIFSFVQARACAEAGAYLISPFVGRILDWHRAAHPEIDFEPEAEPGVQQVSAIYHFLRRHDYPTVLMGASFRNSGEILALAGCDRLTISPALLEELDSRSGTVIQALVDTQQRQERPAPVSEAEFRWQLNEDPMATQKLAEGIRGFQRDHRALQGLVRERLVQAGVG